MAKLEIQERVHHTLDIVMHNGALKQFKIPSELTVSEVERLLEAQIKLDKLQLEQVVDNASAQLRLYWGYIFNQLEAIFQHYHPEITVEYLKDNILQDDAHKILKFFANNRYIDSMEDQKKSVVQ